MQLVRPCSNTPVPIPAINTHTANTLKLFLEACGGKRPKGADVMLIYGLINLFWGVYKEGPKCFNV